VTEAPTTTPAALRAAIIASPEDDGPRLVYADWLDENREPDRAEFIRVQCELHRLEFASFPLTGHSRYIALRELEGRLWSSGCIRWFQHAGFCTALTPDGACGKPAHGFPRRGFIETIHSTLAAFLGGDCPACWGTGDLGTLGGRIGCNVCSDTWSKRGTGRVPGAAAVCRVEPVTKVVLVGCEPYENSSGQWQWYDARRTNQTIHPQSDLPGELWDLLKQPARGTQKDHPTRDDALDALSRACIRWARGQGPA
jgi:uncharacterized protein (TIGR02996 family)